MNSVSNEMCPVCDEGRLRTQRIDYTLTVAGDIKVTIPDLLVEVCDHCGEVVLSADAADAVDAAVAEQTEQLTPRELERIRENFEVDQTDMSEILGLGGKTYHRWEKGNQVPSRSMGYYLRVLHEFPEAFAWLRERRWRCKNRLAAAPASRNLGKAFPCLDLDQISRFAGERSAFNPAKALFGKAA